MAAGDILSTDETPKWVEARDRAVLTLLYACGLRISEAIGLTLSQSKSTPLVITGKGGKTRVTVFCNREEIATPSPVPTPMEK
mgnify:CR=1 FL=1